MAHWLLHRIECLAPVTGTDLKVLFDVLAERGWRLEPRHIRNPVDRQRCGFQKLARQAKALIDQPVDQRHAGRLAEVAGKGAAAHGNALGQIVNAVCPLEGSAQIIEQDVETAFGINPPVPARPVFTQGTPSGAVPTFQYGRIDDARSRSITQPVRKSGH